MSFNDTRLYFHNNRIEGFDDYETFKVHYEKNMKGKKGWHNLWAGIRLPATASWTRRVRAGRTGGEGPSALSDDGARLDA